MAPRRHELPKETHKGVLRARRSLSLYNFSQRFAHACEGAGFSLSYTQLFTGPTYIILLLP
jgi:hypothetical protein